MRTIRLASLVLLLIGVFFLASCSSEPAMQETAVVTTATAGEAQTTSDAPLAGAPGGTPGTLLATPAGVAQGTPEVMMTGTPGEMMASTPGAMRGADEFDRMFIDMMVPHHQSAIEMARIALERSQDPDIRRIAEKIAASQQQEIDRMLDLREAWYGSRETPPMSEMPMLTGMEGMGMGGHTMDMEAEVENLRNASEPFDLAFIDAMIPHHQQALDVARLALEQATRPDVSEMAEFIIEDQQREIEELERLRVQLGGEPTGTATP
jgi:uncharacterized protein (DUF305 family)